MVSQSAQNRPLRVLIVDDEEPSRQRLKRLLAELNPTVEVVGEAGDGLEALDAIADLAPDVVFLDITMPRLDGLGVAQTLASAEDGTKPVARLVFITAHDDLAIRAFEVHATDYLLKPVNPARLAQTVTRLQQTLPPPTYRAVVASLPQAGQSTRLAVKCGAKYRIVAVAEIVALVARDDYAAVVMDDREMLVDEPLEVLASRLSGADFVRVHRSAVINLNHLKELVREGDRKYSAVMANHLESRIAVSRDRLPELKVKLGLD